MAWAIDADHDPSDIESARNVVGSDGIPVGVIYRNQERKTFHKRIEEIGLKTNPKTTETLLKRYAI